MGTATYPFSIFFISKFNVDFLFCIFQSAFKERASYPNMDSSSVHFPSGLCAPPVAEPVPSDWITEEGDFVMVYGVNAAYIGADLNVAPKARINDGVIWLLVIKKGISR